jgi:hypothetical protein
MAVVFPSVIVNRIAGDIASVNLRFPFELVFGTEKLQAGKNLIPFFPVVRLI